MLMTLLLANDTVRGKESSMNQTRVSYLSAIVEEAEAVIRDPCKTYSCSSAVQTLENESSQVEGNKVLDLFTSY